MGTILFILLLFASGLALAGVYYLRGTATKTGALLLCIRVALITALVCALIEPVLKFERLARRQNIIPVLVDASASMRLFRPDSSVLPFLRSLVSVTKDNAGAQIRVVPYCFGDSLRQCGVKDSVGFSDRQSFLPLSFQEKSAVPSPLFVIITDGNFSNASLPKELFSDRTFLYLGLPPVSPQPFLTAEILSVNEHAVCDSPSVALVRAHGYAGTDGDLIITCKEKSGLVSRRTISSKKGFFLDTVSIRLPTSRQGRFLYTVTVASDGDMLRRTLYFPQTVVPGRFTARIMCGVPSLDQRFLALALQNDPQWSITGNTAKECDAIFFIDFNPARIDSLTNVATHGIVVFLGAPACPGREAFSPASFSLVTYQPDDSFFQQFGAVDLPPPSSLYRCPVPFLSRQRPILGCLVPHDNTTRDTIPFLFTGTFGRNDAVAIPGRELWRMDFLPLSVAPRNETVSFLRYLTSFVKEQIILNGARNFCVYPSAAELYENDSCVFTVLLPSDFNDIAVGNTGCTVRFTIDSLSRTVCTTAPLPVNFKEPRRGTVTLPPLAGGIYHYRCTFETKGQKGSVEDSLYVDDNREELSVPGQNTTLLDQFSLPLRKNSVAAVLDAYAGASSSKRSTVFDTFEIRKSWVLMAIIIVLMAAEWIVRRRLELE